jgi:hypothetical protein
MAASPYTHHYARFLQSGLSPEAAQQAAWLLYRWAEGFLLSPREMQAASDALAIADQ